MLAISQVMLNAQSAAGDAVATPAAFEHSGCATAVHTVVWSTGVTAGAVAIEAAASPTYTGTWASLASIAFAADTAVTFVSSGPYKAFRHRISTAVAGGTVTTSISGESA